MMKIFLFLVVFSLFLFRYYCIKSTDLCFIADEECKGHYNQKLNYEVKCEKKKCKGDFKKQCDANYCGRDFFSCQQFNRIQQVLRALIKAKMNRNLVVTYKTFKASIKKCSSEDYKFQNDDICLNGQNCYLKKTIALKYENIGLVEKVDCACEKKLSFKCTANYCALNKKSCDSFRGIYLGALNSSLELSELKQCGNQNKLYRV
jgi:hypothetical protein